MKMRRVIARGLLGMALLALLGDLLFAWKLIPAYQKMQRTGDGAGFGLGLTFLLFLFLPLTLDLALAGLLLDPSVRLQKARAMRAGVCGAALVGGPSCPCSPPSGSRCGGCGEPIISISSGIGPWSSSSCRTWP